jgi:hypothetical protein
MELKVDNNWIKADRLGVWVDSTAGGLYLEKEIQDIRFGRHDLSYEQAALRKKDEEKKVTPYDISNLQIGINQIEMEKRIATLERMLPMISNRLDSHIASPDESHIINALKRYNNNGL